MSVTVGITGHAETVVCEKNTAAFMGSGQLPVFATPAMVALMEQAASTSLLHVLDAGQGTVGTHMDVAHLSATPIGLKVYAESEVTAVDGRTVTFRVSAFDEAGLIGSGTHTRVIISENRFLEKAQQKV